MFLRATSFKSMSGGHTAAFKAKVGRAFWLTLGNIRLVSLPWPPKGPYMALKGLIRPLRDLEKTEKRLEKTLKML